MTSAKIIQEGFFVVDIPDLSNLELALPTSLKKNTTELHMIKSLS